MSAILGVVFLLISSIVLAATGDDILATTPTSTLVASSARVPLNKTFDSFDFDKNGFISLSELARATATTQENSRQPFKAADTDGKTLGMQEGANFKIN